MDIDAPPTQDFNDMSESFEPNSIAGFPGGGEGFGEGEVFGEGSGGGRELFFGMEEEETDGDRLSNMRPSTEPTSIFSKEYIEIDSINPTTEEPIIESTSYILLESESASSTVKSEEPEISTTSASATLGNKDFSEREKIILISTIVPALTIILILSLLLAYFIFKRQRISRVGTQAVKEDQEAQQGSNGWVTNNGRPQTSHSVRGSQSDGNGVRNGAARAWESEEVAARHETDSC